MELSEELIVFENPFWEENQSTIFENQLADFSIFHKNQSIELKLQ